MTLTWYRHFYRNGGLNQILKRQTSRSHYGSKVPAVTITVPLFIRCKRSMFPDYGDIGIYHEGSPASTSPTTNKTLHSSIGTTDVSCSRRRCYCHYVHVGPNGDKLSWIHGMTSSHAQQAVVGDQIHGKCVRKIFLLISECLGILHREQNIMSVGNKSS